MTKRKKKTNPTPYWTKVIERAKKRKKKGLEPFTDYQRDLSEEWVTCACGKQDARIPRDHLGLNRGAPLDDRLRHLGNIFCCHVTDGEVVKAGRTLKAIEHRAFQVLRDGRFE